MEDLSSAIETLCGACTDDLRQIESTKIDEIIRKLRVARLPPPANKFSTALGKKAEVLVDFFAQTPENAVGTSPATKDHRVLDILVASGSGENTLQAKFRRALAEWSLAAAYDLWDQGARLTAISKQRTFNVTKKTRPLSIDSFMRTFFNEEDASTVRSGVAAGLRYHAIDKVYPGCGILLGFAHHHATHTDFLEITAALGSRDLIKLRELGTLKKSWMIEAWKHYRPQDTDTLGRAGHPNTNPPFSGLGGVQDQQAGSGQDSRSQRVMPDMGRELAKDVSSRKRQRVETGTAPCLLSSTSCQDLVVGEKQAANSHSFQSDSFTSTLSTTSRARRQSTDSTTLKMQGQQSSGLSHIKTEELCPMPNCSRVLCSPPPPQAILVPDYLFRNIKTYFQESCRKMTFDEYETLLGPDGTELRSSLCSDFDSYCFTASIFERRGMYSESRCALSSAGALVEQILRAEHPRTLACFLEVFIHLIQTGHLQVTDVLRRFVKDTSARVIETEHPWGLIWRFLGELDSKNLYDAMTRIWECTIKTFQSELGTSHRLAVSVRLDYIKRVYRFERKLEEEERLLRDLLSLLRDQGGILPIPRVMLNLAHNLNGQGLYDEAEKIAQEVLSLLGEQRIFAERDVERIECMKVISHSQNYQGNTVKAEQTMRNAIGMIVDYWGTQHSWILEFKNVLEGWLRDWGQKDAADVLRREIEEWMGKDALEDVL
jgi:tetratricopeptide (TPR) repeat protein